MSDQDYWIRSIRCGAGSSHRIFDDSRAIQQAVFVEEQGIDPDDVFEHEHEGIHFVLYLKVDDQFIAVACARVMGSKLRHPIKIGRVATLKQHRHNKYARRLLEHIIDEQGQRYEPPYFYLNSQVDARGLYESLQFRPKGEMFNEAGIRHIRMELPWPTEAA